MIIEAINKKLWEENRRKIKGTGIFYSNNFAKFYYNSKLYIYENKGNISLFPLFIKNQELFSFRYGGMLSNKCNNEFFRETKLMFKRFCIQNKIKKIVIRSHPFLKTIKIGRIIKKEPFVYIDLSRSKAKLERALSRRHQECIKNATKAGLIFVESRRSNYLKLFYRLYAPMLRKKGITPEGFDYFKRLFRSLKSNLRFASVRYKDEVVAVSMLLESAGDIYMMYGGMDETGYRKYAKHFMIYNLIFQHKKLGYKRLVLGTGEKPGDSIYLFKRGFTDKSHYLNTYEKIVP